EPPQLARNRAMLPEQPVRSAWEARSLEGWTEIGARFGVSQVIVAADWRLRLPELARSDRFALYSVEPAPRPPRPPSISLWLPSGSRSFVLAEPTSLSTGAPSLAAHAATSSALATSKPMWALPRGPIGSPGSKAISVPGPSAKWARASRPRR